MDSRAEVVMSILRWALNLVFLEESKSGGIPGPRLSQFSLGNMMSRSDIQTCEAIARDIAEIRATDEAVCSLMDQIRSQWGDVQKTKTRRSGNEDALTRAHALVSALRRSMSARECAVLEAGARAKSWKAAEVFLPGRLWESIRDDFEKHALVFYNREKPTILLVSDYHSAMYERARA